MFICGNVLHKSVGEMPAHSHTGLVSTTNLTGTISYVSKGRRESGIFNLQSIWNTALHGSAPADEWGFDVILNATHNHSVTINNSGSNQAHNNMQPYITCYMWKRTI